MTGENRRSRAFFFEHSPVTSFFLKKINYLFYM